MATDCYHMLGIPRDASISRIRRAFRRFCNEHDPDRDEAHASQFDTMCEAFETLLSRDRRFRHDLALYHAGADHEVEPGMATEGVVDLLCSFESHQPSREEIEQRFAQNFTGRGLPKSHPVQQLTIEVTIPPDAARSAGVLPIDVPVARVCQRCGGSGSTGFAPCDDCDGHGLFWDTARVDIALSPPVRDGTVLPVSLKHLGIENLYLRVLVRVMSQTVDA